MEMLAKFLGELLMMVVGLAIFVVCVGIKVECPQCQSRFYHRHKICPDCDYEFGTPLPDKEEMMEDEETDPLEPEN